jgi:hypothetical protein
MSIQVCINLQAALAENVNNRICQLTVSNSNEGGLVFNSWAVRPVITYAEGFRMKTHAALMYKQNKS